MNGAAVKLLARIENARSQLVAAKLPDKAVRYCIAGLERMERVLARAPRVAILGEVNSGKTSVADLLLGARPPADERRCEHAGAGADQVRRSADRSLPSPRTAAIA